MSFIGDLFGSGSSTPAPQPTSAAPKISDAESQSAALEESSRQKGKFGTDKTILTSGLGDTSSGASNINRTSALGGNSSLTQ
ncbi:hypothetical protein CO683_00780 [Bradyrhizobium ottawaense]|uniref:hypothetical protein n=1 Tax=Bradyrhizobium ottawaense TaxID=931866 RepID=UPI000BE81098|nr:hypothetical protein [Bradyrhizobium ottawaense]PDT71726.1 hypothetical protein CO683_00780 [Bradyrhizobium ottawaense]